MFIASELRDIFRAVECRMSDPSSKILLIVTDSRQISQGDQSLFFALRGKRTDGHHYLSAAWERGIRNFVVETLPDVDLTASNIFLVTDAVHALQLLAITHRTRFDIPCIGITGSNGKTWVKEWLFQLLSIDHHIVKSPRSYNSQIGVPLSVLRMRDHHTLAIFEAGISEVDEMDALSVVIRPTIGILTHFGDAHDAGFADSEQKLREKCKLFKTADTVLFAGDDPWLAGQMHELITGKEMLSWGYTVSAEMQVDASAMSSGSQIVYRYAGNERTMHIPYQDAASIRNALTCCLVMEHMSYAPKEIARRLALVQPMRMRLEIHQLPERCLLIDDSYSLDIASLQVGLETLEQHSAGMDQVVIVSDIDHQRAKVYADIGRLLSERRLKAVYTIGKEIGQLSGLSAEHVHFPDVDAFIESRIWYGQSNTAFLLKGARRFGMERIVQYLQARKHSAVLEIDLNAMLSNLQYFRSRLKPACKIIAMVKAAAYGSGAAEIGKFLEFNNVDALCVAYLDEGIELRTAGVRIPIIVMNPDTTAIRHMVEHQLEPEVFDLDALRLLTQYSHDHQCDIKIHIKLDTGMHRLGFVEKDMNALREMLMNNGPSLKVASVFTHLAASSNPNERNFTMVQLNLFEAFHQGICAALGYRPERHILNTSGVLHYPEYQFEAVRLGIGLYGVGIRHGPPDLEAVHTLKARISQVRDVPAGASIGYDRAFIADQPMRIATMNIGYADGFKRLAGNGRFSVLIDGFRASVVGNVCMDMTMLDVTGSKRIKAGDEVIVFGPAGTLETLADACQTIPYEILTGISMRIPRIFRFA